MSKFRLPSRDQLSLLPRSIEDFVGLTDGVRVIDALVEELDLSSIERQYSDLGGPAFHPKLLVKILVWGTIRGVRSSRELAQSCRENLRFMYLANGAQPDFRTISLFRKRFSKELGELLKQTVLIGLREGLITLETVAIDGTKLRAYAGARSFKSVKSLEAEAEVLEALIAEAIAKGISADEKEDEDLGDGDGGFHLPPELQNKQKRVEKIRQALGQYQQEQGSKPVKVSTTDPESRFMKSKGVVPSYNAQAAVDATHGLVVGGYVTTAGSDHGELKKNLEEIEATAGRNPKEAVADKGYRADEGLEELVKRDIDGYLPLQGSPSTRFGLEVFKYDEDSDTYECPAGEELSEVNDQSPRQRRIFAATNCSTCSMRTDCLPKGARQRYLVVSDFVELVSDMNKKIKLPRAEQLRKIRSSTVEPLFGTIKAARKLYQLNIRGLQRVNRAWKFELAVHNLQRLATSRKPAIA